jgi:hypothetical protein
LVIFAMQAGVKLGRKLNEVLIDETQARPLFLPLGWLGGIDIERADALEYFLNHPELTTVGAPYVGLNDDEKVQAYKSIIRVDARLGGLTDSREDALEVVMGLHQYRQFKEGFGPQHPLKRILGTVVEIGIDYFAANPQLIAGSAPSPERKLLVAFVATLDDISFSEGTSKQIVAGLFRSTLETLHQNVALVDDDERVQALVGGITKALVDDLEALEDQPRSSNERI